MRRLLTAALLLGAMAGFGAGFSELKHAHQAERAARWHVHPGQTGPAVYERCP